MYRKPQTLKALALCALLASAARGSNLFVLPTFTGNATSSATVYSGNPLTAAGTFTTASDAFIVLARPTLLPADTKYYVISRSGSNSLIILNSALTPVGTPISFGQNVSTAALTPNGQQLLIVSGNLRIYNTQDDSEVRTSFLDVGLNPNDIAITPDSTRAFVMSAQGQRITAVDLTTNQIVGNIPLPGITSGSATMGPNGLLYVSAEGRVLEIDPRATPFDSAAIRRQFTFGGARITRLQFTPDGTRAVAGNLSPQSGHALIYFSLDLLNAQTAVIAPTDSLSGFLFEKVFVAGNDRAYAVTSGTSVQARKIYQLSLPVPPVTGALPPPVVTEAFFGSLGNMPIVDTIAFTPEYPQATRMYVSAPLNLLQQNAQNTIYTVALTSNPPNVSGQTPIAFVPGPLNFTGPAITAAEEPPSGIIPINANQGTVGLGGRTLPFGVRVIGASGRPIFGVPVTFSPITSGVTLLGTATATSNSNGIAMISAQAPAAAGPFSIAVAIGSSGLTTGFNFSAVGGSGGGGGGGGGGTNAGQLAILQGDGQAVYEGNESKDIRIRLLNPAGAPVVGSTVTWAVTQGLSRFATASFVDENGRVTTTTDSKGESVMRVRAQVVEINKSFSQNILTATVGDQTATIYITSVLSTSGGGIAPPPSANFQSPDEQRGLTGKAGQVLTGAIVAQIVASTGPELGQIIPNVGMEVRVESLQVPPPSAECSPKRVPLGNEQGIVTCDLKLTGRAGTGTLIVTVGGYTERKFPLRVDAGEPNELKILNGNNQSGDINQVLSAPLVVELGDGGGNTLGSATVRWEIIQGQATLTNSTTVTDNNGRASNTVKLGTQSGTILIRATALGGKQPSVTFESRVNVTVSGLVKVSGDPQTTFTNSAFANPLSVLVLDNRQIAVPGVTVNFTVNSGSATLSSGSVTTDSSGRASVSVRAGGGAGPIVITAITQGVAQGVTFNLTSQLPGPIPGAFLNAASGERGAVVPGGIFTLQGQGLAPDLRGCIEGVAVIGQIPTRLNQVELQFGTTLAPIFSVCNLNGQETVTFQAPFELTPGFPVSVIARVGAGSTTINNVQVRDYQPGTFEDTDSQGRKYAVAIKPNGTYVTPDNPARYGEIIRVFITGAGQTTPAAATGATGVTGQRLGIDVVVGLNDLGVRVVSAEYARGLVGVYEVQFEVPQGTQTGATRPLGILLARPSGQFVFPDNSPSIAIAP